MKKLLSLTLTGLVSTYASSVSADNNWYVGAAYSSQNISSPSQDYNTSGLIAGYNFNKYIALEGRYSIGTSGHNPSYEFANQPTVHYSDEIVNQASLFLKISYPIFDSLNEYAIAGHSGTKSSARVVSFVNDAEGNEVEDVLSYQSTSDSDLTYGVGVNYRLSKSFNLFIDYGMHPKPSRFTDSSGSLNNTTVGINYVF